MFDADERLVICNQPYARIYNLPPELMQPGTHARATSSSTASPTAWCPVGGREAYCSRRRELVDQARRRPRT